MASKVQKWGNRQGLRLGQHVLEEAQIAVGDEVIVSVEGAHIVITPVRCVRGRVRLEELLSRIPRGYRLEECDWGRPQGGDTW